MIRQNRSLWLIYLKKICLLLLQLPLRTAETPFLRDAAGRR
jgi:hypothetical protein